MSLHKHHKNYLNFYYMAPRKQTAEDNIEKTEIDIKHQFSEKELKKISEQLADLIKKRTLTELEFAAVKTKHKTEVQEIDNEIEKFSTCIIEKCETRPTPAYLRRNYSRGVREYLSVIDKTEILKEEPLTKEDKQYKMKLDEQEEENEKH